MKDILPNIVRMYRRIGVSKFHLPNQDGVAIVFCRCGQGFCREAVLREECNVREVNKVG